MSRLHVVQSSSLSSGLNGICIGGMQVDKITTKVLSSAGVVKVTVGTDDYARPVVLVDQITMGEVFVQVAHSQTYNIMTMTKQRNNHCISIEGRPPAKAFLIP